MYEKMKKIKSIFYVGRPTKGAKLKKIGSVFWSEKWPPEGPWKKDEAGGYVWAVKGYYRRNYRYNEMPHPHPVILIK